MFARCGHINQPSLKGLSIEEGEKISLTLLDLEAIGEREDLEHAKQGRLGGSDFFSFLDQMYFALWRGGRDGVAG